MRKEEKGMKMQYSFDELIELIEQWAEDKGISDGDWSPQFEKFQEEADELMAELEVYDVIGEVTEDLQLEMGDVLVTLIIGAQRLNMDIRQCLDMAYAKISKRTGRVIGGIFVKSEDLEDAGIEPESQIDWTGSCRSGG